MLIGKESKRTLGLGNKLVKALQDLFIQAFIALDIFNFCDKVASQPVGA